MKKSHHYHTALILIILTSIIFARPVAAGPVSDLGNGVTEETVFNDPYVDTTNWDDYAIHKRLIALIGSTREPARINMAIHSLTMPPVTDALIAAAKRGVTVRVVMSGQAAGWPEANRLRVALGSNYKACDAPGSTSAADRVQACISGRDSSIMHSKFATFSKVVDGGTTKTNVVAVTSANMTWSQADAYNNLVLVAGDSTTYGAYNAVFDDMFNNRRNNNYQASPHGYATSSAAKSTSYFQPRADSSGGMSTEHGTDSVADHLGYLTGGNGCSVKAAQALITDSRPGITAQLLRIKKAGCQVRVAYSQIGATAAATLQQAGIVLCRVRDGHSNSNVVTTIHSKYYIVHGTYAGSTNASRVFTGSHNWTLSALRANDEVILKLWDAGIVNEFNKNFDKIWARSCSG